MWLACCINPQSGGPGDFDEGFLPLALDTPFCGTVM